MALEKNPEFLQAFGLRVKSLRMSKGYSLREMADILNIDNHQLSRIENAKINTSILMAYAISQVLEVPISDLFIFPVEP